MYQAEKDNWELEIEIRELEARSDSYSQQVKCITYRKNVKIQKDWKRSLRNALFTGVVGGRKWKKEEKDWLEAEGGESL